MEINPENIKLNLTPVNSKNSYSVGDDLTIKFLVSTVPDDIDLYNDYLDLQWLKNGTNISEANYDIKRNGSMASLKIKSFSKVDAGDYFLFGNFLNQTQANASFFVDIDYLSTQESRFNFINDDSAMSHKEIVLLISFVLIGSVLLTVSVMLGKKIRQERRQKRELEELSQNLFESGQMELLNPNLPLEEQVELLPYDRRWEFPRENLKLGPVLGLGNFGRVVQAEAHGIELDYEDGSTTLTVAVKMLKERANMSQRKALLAELKILIHVGRHLNIVNLLGAVTKDLVRGDLMVIVEFCKFGNLRSYLLARRSMFVNQINPDTDEIDPKITKTNDCRENQSSTEIAYQNLEPCHLTDLPLISQSFVTTSNLLSYIFQCAKGMEYLATRKLVHRDLAARNVLLAEDDVIKICDFGLARDTYDYEYYVKTGEGDPMPIKWMAVESIRDKIFNAKSDVWSYGIFVWEVFTLGATPYPGMEVDEKFFKRLVEGYRLDKPEFATEWIYQLMQSCWTHQPEQRPSFEEIGQQLGFRLEEAAINRYQLKQMKAMDNQMYMAMDQTEGYMEMHDQEMATTSSQQQIFSHLQLISGPVVLYQHYDTVTNSRPIYDNLPKASEQIAMTDLSKSKDSREPIKPDDNTLI